MNDECLDCGHYRQIKARGLCGGCYYWRGRNGTLAERPTISSREGRGLADSPLDYGITYRQLDYWCRQGYLSAGTPGTGSWRSWSDADREVARLMAALTAGGVTASAAARIARTDPEAAEQVAALLSPLVGEVAA